MTEKPEILRFEDFTVDLARQELTRAGTVVEVEPQVFDLIAYLAANADHVVSRDELIEGVWQGRIVSDGAISTRINAARAALGDDGKAQRLIRTIPRRGFRFIGDLDAPRAPIPVPQDKFVTSGVRYLKSFDGTFLAYETIGEGPWLVKTPNFLSHLEFERYSPIWQSSIRELSRDHAYLRVDQRGNGLSDRDAANLSFEAYVQDVKAVMDALGIERAPLFGISQGVSIAIEFARRWPERVSGLILLGGYAAGWRRLGDEDWKARREAMVDLIRSGWGSDNPVFRRLYTELFVPGGDEALKDWFTELQRVSATPETAARLISSFGDFDVRDAMPKVTQPALVMHCRGDGVVPFEAGRQLAIHLPNARFVALESANHIPLEGFDCWPVFIRETRAFLESL